MRPLYDETVPSPTLAVPSTGGSGARRFARTSKAGGQGRRVGRITRRLFDTGSFFGVGVPEATVIALLGWFLLGPEELFKVAKQLGNWLGEARTFISQAARQYESTLNDESTRKAIDGIRETQRKVAEVATSFRGVADSFRDPLAIGSTIESTLDKYSKEPERKIDTGPVKPKDVVPDVTSADPEPVVVTPDEITDNLKKVQGGSRQAFKGSWVNALADKAEVTADRKAVAAEYLSRLDARLMEIDSMMSRLQEVREEFLADRADMRSMVDGAAVAAAPAAAAAPSPAPAPEPAPAP